MMRIHSKKGLTFYSLDLAKCYKIFYNGSEKEITNFIIWGAFLYSENYKELDHIIGSMLDSNSKKQLLEKVGEINMRRDGTLSKKEAKEWGDYIAKSLKDEGYNSGREVGSQETLLKTIKSMLENGATYDFISKVTQKSIDEIKEIEKSIEE